MPLSAPAEAEDNSCAEPDIVLPIAVAATISKSRIEILCLNEANADFGSESPVRAATKAKHERIVSAEREQTASERSCIECATRVAHAEKHLPERSQMFAPAQGEAWTDLQARYGEAETIGLDGASVKGHIRSYAEPIFEVIGQ